MKKLYGYANKEFQQDHRTTGPQDHRTTGPQDHRTTGPQDHRTTIIVF